MNWRWLFFDYVPRSSDLSVRQRRAVRGRAFWLMLEAMWKCADEAWKDERPSLSRSRQPLRARLPMLALLLILYAAILGLRLAEPLVAAWGIRWGVAGAIALPAIGLWIALVVIGAYSMRPHAVSAARELGYEVCQSCWYPTNGRASDQARCPECGAAREPMPEVES